MEYVTDGVVENNEVSGVRINNVEGEVQVINEESFLSFNVLVRNNIINVNTGSTGVYVRDPRGGVTVSGNRISSTAGKKGIFLENILSTGLTRVSFNILDNTVENFANGVVISTRGDAYSQVSINNNVIDHNQQPSTATIGILFSSTGSYQSFAQVLSNTFGSGILKPILVQ
jgi:hypothetical protein